MTDPQFWGAIRGVLIALGGAVAALGIMSATEWAALVNQALSVAMAVAGLIAIVLPMYQGWKSRSRKGSIEAASAVLKPGEVIVVDHALAAVIPSPQVVGPTGLPG